MVAWPALLPSPSFEGYAIEPVDPTLRTDMEAGAARTRRRTAARNDQINVTWRFSDREMAIFRAWFDGANYAAGGASWFSVTLAVGDLGLRTWEARFIGPGKPTLMAGMLWQVSAKLEIRGGELTADQIHGAVLGLLSLSGVYPSLVLDFAGDLTLDSRVTFARSTTATYFNAAGVMQTAAINAPRFDHNPVTGESLGLLIEEQRTNLMLYSSDLSSAWWNKDGITIYPTAEIAPDGAASAYLAVASAANADLYQYASVTPGTVGSMSIFLKRKIGSGPLYCVNGAGGRTLITESIGSTSWTRVELTSASAANGYCGIRIANPGDEVYVWGGQYEVGAFVTSHIKTTTSAVTRGADLAVMSGANFTGWFSHAQGAFFAEFMPGTAANMVDAPGVLGHFMMAWNTSFTSLAIWDGSIAVQTSAPVIGATNKAASTYSGTTKSININGLPPATGGYDGAFGTADFYIGYGNGPINGHIRRIAYYPSRLPDADLVALTA